MSERQARPESELEITIANILGKEVLTGISSGLSFIPLDSADNRILQRDKIGNYLVLNLTDTEGNSLPALIDERTADAVFTKREMFEQDHIESALRLYSDMLSAKESFAGPSERLYNHTLLRVRTNIRHMVKSYLRNHSSEDLEKLQIPDGLLRMYDQDGQNTGTMQRKRKFNARQVVYGIGFFDPVAWVINASEGYDRLGRPLDDTMQGARKISHLKLPIEIKILQAYGGKLGSIGWVADGKSVEEPGFYTITLPGKNGNRTHDNK